MSTVRHDRVHLRSFMHIVQRNEKIDNVSPDLNHNAGGRRLRTYTNILIQFTDCLHHTFIILPFLLFVKFCYFCVMKQQSIFFDLYVYHVTNYSCDGQCPRK
jgi:hypothetical protein